MVNGAENQTKNTFKGKKVILDTDINLENRDWTPIGKDKDHPFQGTFDGQGYTISGLNINVTDSSSSNTTLYYGLFGYVEKVENTENSGIIQDLAVKGTVSVTTSSGSSGNTVYVGGIVGYIDGTIQRCCNTTDSDSESDSVSGTGGCDEDDNNYDTVYVGGVAGYANTIQNCYNTGNVSISGSSKKSDSHVGGVVGYVKEDNSAENCYNTGKVSASNTIHLDYISGVANSATNFFYPNDIIFIDNVVNNNIGVSTPKAQFNSGEVAWKLQNHQKDKDSQVWGQNLTGESKDAAPILTTNPNERVYQVEFKDVTPSSYTLYQTNYVNLNGKVTPPADPAKNGYTFAGWFDKQTGGNSFTANTQVTKDITVYSQWTPKLYTVTFNTDGGNAIQNQTVYYGSTVTPPADPTKSGHTFAGWYNDNTAWNFSQNLVTGDLTLTAHWTPITPPSSSGGSSSHPSITVPVFSEVGSVKASAVVKNRTASVRLSERQLGQVVGEGAETVTVDCTKLKNVTAVTLPARLIKTTRNLEDARLTIALPTGTVSLDSTALNSLPAGKDVTISVKRASTADLTERQQAAVAGKAKINLVFDVEIRVKDEPHTNLNGGKATISIPYTPKKDETPSKLTVWQLRDNGMIFPMGGSYDEETECFVFVANSLPLHVS